MQAREFIGSAQVPGGEELTLYRRGGDFMIVLDRNELMSSRMSGSEEALANLSCERLRGRARPHLLIGGYGMGFTLRRSEEHTSELQSLMRISYAVFCLKKKTTHATKRTSLHNHTEQTNT